MGHCVRIGAMVVISSNYFELKKMLLVKSDMIRQSSQWAKVVPNTREASMTDLTPVAVTGTLTVPVGRLRRNQYG